MWFFLCLDRFWLFLGLFVFWWWCLWLVVGFLLLLVFGWICVILGLYCVLLWGLWGLGFFVYFWFIRLCFGFFLCLGWRLVCWVELVWVCWIGCGWFLLFCVFCKVGWWLVCCGRWLGWESWLFFLFGGGVCVCCGVFWVGIEVFWISVYYGGNGGWLVGFVVLRNDWIVWYFGRCVWCLVWLCCGLGGWWCFGCWKWFVCCWVYRGGWLDWRWWICWFCWGLLGWIFCWVLCWSWCCLWFLCYWRRWIDF